MGGVLHVLLVKHLTGAACRKCLAESAASLENSLPARHLLNAGNLRPPPKTGDSDNFEKKFVSSYETKVVGEGGGISRRGRGK